MNFSDKYEAVIGLEVHMQLLTKSKAFSSDANLYGESPNTLVDMRTLGHPGTLPRLNERTVEFAVKLGLATHCKIREVNEFARKNYFYADLPKGYQITQDTTPICTEGFLKIKIDGTEKRIGITRIHMEEDAGKSIHDIDPYHTLIDLNRAGVPLLEMVSEPDLRNSDDAYQYLTEVRKLVRYLEICDGNMEEGSLRCDANVSVRLRGAEKFGEKVEIKNMNSIRNVKRALEYEIERQIEALEKGEKIEQQTRSFDAAKGSTFVMRSKESAHDYRYFPEPDLNPVIVDESFISHTKEMMPSLPEELFEKYTTTLGLSEYDARVLTDEKGLAHYFEELIALTKNYKSAANWVMGAVKSFMNERAVSIEDFPVPPKSIAEIIRLIDEGTISHSTASQKLFPALIENPVLEVELLARTLNLIQETNLDALHSLIDQALAKYPDKIIEYKNGKNGVLGLFIGEVMKLSKGTADPKIVNKLLLNKLNQN